MDKDKIYDISIIGGGASGLIAAINAASVNPDASIIVFEKMELVGKKVSAAGNGRCNLSNVDAENWELTSAFFSSIGLITRVDSEGRVYPYSEDGRDVSYLLYKACLDRNVEFALRREVTSILKTDEGFGVTAIFNKPKAYRERPEDAPITIRSKKVLISTGGKSKPKLGTTGDGYRLAKALGHSVNTLTPVLTGVETVEDIKSLQVSGIREKVEISLFKNNNLIFQEKGEVQFTDYGISGICVFNLSRFLLGLDLSEYEIHIDFAPEISEEALKRIISDKKDGISSIVKAPLWDAIDETARRNYDGSKALALKKFPLHPKSLRGWEMAQVTRGGIPLSEIKKETGESLLVPGLYFSGEMLDVDFMCGGFNLQHAWTSGLKAGLSMAESLTSK